MIFALLAAANLSLVTSTPTGQSIVNACWEGNAHPEMTECVVKKAAAAQASLEGFESDIGAALAKQENEDLAAAFQVAVVSYRAYRDQQCQLQGAFAEAGNGAYEIQRACEAALDLSRAEQLKAGLGRLEPGPN
jgi:uncharacterized protein YecT (DUF1311 family)